MADTLSSIVVPSHLQNETEDFHSDVENQNSLLVGTVTDIKYPADTNFPFVVYQVCVQQKRGDTPVNVYYDNVIQKDAFGSIPDYLEYSNRIASNFSTNNQGTALGTDSSTEGSLGSTVLMQCINGSVYQGIIVGALRVRKIDPQTLEDSFPPNYTSPTQNTTPYLNFSFNGINININQDGECNIQRWGPQQDDGTPVDDGDADKSVSINFNKDGQVIISTSNTQNTVFINQDGSMQISVGGGKTLIVQDKDDDAQMTLGSGTYSAAVAEKLQQLYNNLYNFLSSMTFPTGTGPSGVAINLAQLPQWDSSIVSGSLKIPK